MAKKIKEALIVTEKQLSKLMMADYFMTTSRVNPIYRKKVYLLVGAAKGKLILIEKEFKKRGEYLILK